MGQQLAGLFPALAAEHEFHHVFQRQQRIARFQRCAVPFSRGDGSFVEFFRLYGFHVSQFRVQFSIPMFKVKPVPTARPQYIAQRRG